MPGLQRSRIQVHGHQPRFAAIRVGDSRALHRDQLSSNEVESQIVQLLFGNGLATDSNLQNRHARSGILNDERRRRPWRQKAQKGLRDRRHLRDGGLNIGGGAEVNLHYGHTGKRLRIDVVNVIDERSQSALGGRSDAICHLLRCQTLIVPNDANDRDVDFRKDIRRGSQDDDRRKDQYQQRHHHKRVGPAQRECNNPHRIVPWQYSSTVRQLSVA